MKKGHVPSSGFTKTALNVTALVLSRLKRCDIDKEAERLSNLPRSRAYAEAAAVGGGLFALALISASFGWLGLGLYFLVIFIAFK